jgi:ketosteroid isomerase-like protein
VLTVNRNLPLEGTMSQQIEMVKKAYAAFGRGDVPGILECLTDDIAWEPIYGAGPHVPHAGRRQGKREVTEFFRLLADSTDFQSFEPREFFENANAVVVLGSYTATSKATANQISSDWAMIIRFRDGLVAHFMELTNSAALDAAYRPAVVTV